MKRFSRAVAPEDEQRVDGMQEGGSNASDEASGKGAMSPGGLTTPSGSPLSNDTSLVEHHGFELVAGRYFHPRRSGFHGNVFAILA
jgi:hypothetical protein